MIFAEALTTLDEYRQFTSAVKVPVLANITEFGKDAAVHRRRACERRRAAGALSAVRVRAMSKAAEAVYGAIRTEGTQKSVVDRMQTRAELYDVLVTTSTSASSTSSSAARRRQVARAPANSSNSDEQPIMSSESPTTPVSSEEVRRLSGVAAGNTALCTVGRSGNDLHYRGYDILDLADQCEFEEVAYLLVHGKLRTSRARRLQGQAQAAARLPVSVRAALERCRPRATRWTCCAPAARCSVARCRRRTTTTSRRARHRRSPDRVVRLDAVLLVPLSIRARASTSRPTTTRSAVTSCTCCTGARRRSPGSRRCTCR